MELLQFWLCSNYLLKIHPSASFSPIILLLFVQNDSIAPLLVLFSYKNRPPGFSSTTTLIGPSVLGLTEVYKWYSSRLSIQPNCRQAYQGFWALGLAPCSVDARRWWAFCAFFKKQARGTQVQVWCLLASQSATKSPSSPKKLPFFSSSWVQSGHAEEYFLCSPWTSVNKSSSQPLTNMSWFVLSKWGICKKGKNLKKLTSAISSLLPMLCFSHRTCFLPTICRD